MEIIEKIIEALAKGIGGWIIGLIGFFAMGGAVYWVDSKYREILPTPGILSKSIALMSALSLILVYYMLGVFKGIGLRTGSFYYNYGNAFQKIGFLLAIFILTAVIIFAAIQFSTKASKKSSFLKDEAADLGESVGGELHDALDS